LDPKLFIKYYKKMSPSNIYITRHGESQYNSQKRIGGNSSITDQGQLYAQKLHVELKSLNLQVWTSKLRRTIETAECFQDVLQLKELNEIDSGTMNGLTYQEIETQFPQEFQKRLSDKYTYKYPQGESYKCLVSRLQPIFNRIQNTHQPILMICHQAIARIILCHLVNGEYNEYTNFSFPLHQCFKLDKDEQTGIYCFS
jgi:broad specificity phosphatase PhoE